MDDVIIAVFPHHQAADVAVQRLVAAGWDIKNLSVVGKRCHTCEGALAFHRIDGPVRFWGPRGAFWGGLWTLFSGGLFITFPGAGIVIVLGYLAATTALVVENEAIVDGIYRLGRLLTRIGIPLESVRTYKGAIKADGFLIMAHGSTNEIAKARQVLDSASPLMLDTHPMSSIACLAEITTSGLAEHQRQYWLDPGQPTADYGRFRLPSIK